MLYRHFPKISNKEISILALSLSGTADNADSAQAAALLRLAAELGINLIDAGSDPARIARLAEIAASTALPAAGTTPLYRLYEFPGMPATGDAAVNGGANGFAAFLERVRGCETDFLAIGISSAAAFAALEETGIIDLAVDARRNGRCGHLGFSCPADGALVTEICDAFDGWDFFRADFSILDPGFVPAIRHAAGREIGFIASDPLAGGYLETVPPAIHELYYRAPVPRSHAEWALRGIWEMQETVSVVLAPRNGDELARNAIFSEAGRPNSLTGRELDVLAAAAKVAGKSSVNP